MKKKQKWSIIVLVALVAMVSGWFLWSSHEQTKEVEGANKKLASLQPKLQKLSKKSSTPSESYSVLSIKADGDNGAVADVVSSQRWSNEQIKSFESELFKQVRDQNGAVDTLTIHVFQSKQDYEQAVSEGYKGNLGLIQTVSSTHKGNSSTITLTSYSQPDKEKEGDIDAVAYDVKDAEVNGTAVTLHVIIEDGKVDMDALSQFVYPFIQVTKDLNPELEQYILHIYSSEEQYEAKQVTGTFEGDLLTVTETIQ